MKKALILIASTFIGLQLPQIITLKEYYDGKGVIFDKNYKYPFIESDYKEPFTPTLKQIKQAEDLFFSSYYEYRTKVLDSFKSNHKLDTKLKEPKKVKNKFFKYYRQYAGYTNSSNDSIIYIGLFNFSNQKKANDYFEGWDKILCLGSGKFYQDNQEFYIMNLTQKKIVFK
ncbi:hypothetical protein GGR22_001297 [Flavobacterium gossypii]|uniref:Uncharacterized protein n=1 Tax=Flavobacterium gossypii TaxID=1646119 RepID=A0ABR6DNA6_9FLAO|nr:hypothetical protein [Flavobacterium gossypii]MBA9073171.1 hypothetical protein [Flavobacterium gossypii]